MTRRILLVGHSSRIDMQRLVDVVSGMLADAGIEAVVSETEMARHRGTSSLKAADPDNPARDCELVLVLGGDGTILRGAEAARQSDIPLLGINYGHIGFLAEAEPDDLMATVERIVQRDYYVEDRMTLDVEAYSGDQLLTRTWALNEMTVEKVSRERMIQAVIVIDGRPLSTWGCDGVIVATPTGSTAYAFSAGGPVLWPDAESLLIVPISAHALFARPLVVSPRSEVAVELSRDVMGRAVMWCDGSRSVDLPADGRVVVRRGTRPVRLAKLDKEPFTDRIVEKFELPVRGWRGNA
ncbi:MAG: NAD kinase [Dermatophilus congolensis]|nr:NAD kinase [Dermatophilus congolensis]